MVRAVDIAENEMATVIEIEIGENDRPLLEVERRYIAGSGRRGIENNSET